MPLTDVQKKVFDALYAYIEENGYPPTFPELSKTLGRKNVSGEITALKKKGWITTLDGHQVRATVVTDEAKDKIKNN